MRGNARFAEKRRVCQCQMIESLNDQITIADQGSGTDGGPRSKFVVWRVRRTLAVHPPESMGQDSILQVLAQFLRDVVGKTALVFLARLRGKCLEMLGDDLVEDAVFGFVALVAATGSTDAGSATTRARVRTPFRGGTRRIQGPDRAVSPRPSEANVGSDPATNDRASGPGIEAPVSAFALLDEPPRTSRPESRGSVTSRGRVDQEPAWPHSPKRGHHHPPVRRRSGRDRMLHPTRPPPRSGSGLGGKRPVLRFRRHGARLAAMQGGDHPGTAAAQRCRVSSRSRRGEARPAREDQRPRVPGGRISDEYDVGATAAIDWRRWWKGTGTGSSGDATWSPRTMPSSIGATKPGDHRWKSMNRSEVAAEMRAGSGAPSMRTVAFIRIRTSTRSGVPPCRRTELPKSG